MAAIGSLAERYGFAVLEDASHAIGGRYQGEPVGNCRHSAITVFSFHPVKIITTGEGGLATTNDPVLAQRMAELRSHGIVRDRERFEESAAGPWVYEQQQLGFNYRITDLQAALGRSQLQRLDEIVMERNQKRQRYQELLADLPVQLLHIPDEVFSSVHLAVIRLKHATAQKHLMVFEGLRARNRSVVALQPGAFAALLPQVGVCGRTFPNAEAYAKSAVSLPLFPGLQANEQKKVSSILSDLLSRT